MKKCLPNYFGNHFAAEGKSDFLESIYASRMPKSVVLELELLDTKPGNPMNMLEETWLSALA